ncbi:MAG: C10 family peptidase [Lentisphaeria bacterium]|nr:C10 family peptidase [Lentisphaeria bacterium]
MDNYTVVPGNADGRILTSTLWQQDGVIVIDGEKLEGYTYNRFCPYISTNSFTRSVTGCTNTADAQILYYFLEQGWELELSVSSSDYFTLKAKRGKKYYLSETSSVGEGTISELNAILADTDNYATGDFIAALNFFCGVKNHSVYGDSTGTSVYVGTFTDGLSNLKAFRAAGFDSYFSVGEDNELFFDTSGSNNQLTDVAYSIIRENLDYGEPVRVDIPMHSIYLDGYRWNSGSGEYEYHLNYGWGVYSTETKWYTVDEIYDISFDTLGLDLDPKIRVTVSNDREEYYGGSFLRGVERINHIQNDTATTFSFVDTIAGSCLELEAIEFSSEVDLEFLNWNITLCVADADALSSENALVFTNLTGAIIVNSALGNTCVTGAEDESLYIELNGGYYFSGTSQKNSDDLRLLLEEFHLNTETLMACINSDAVVAGNDDDVILLKEGACIVGGVDLGAGNNEITVESGSALYGNVSGSRDSVELNLVASGVCERTMVCLKDNGEDFLFSTGGNVNFIAGENAVNGIYDLIGFQGGEISEEFLNSFSVTVKFSDEEYILDSSSCNIGNFELLISGDKISLRYGDEVPTISVVSSEKEWTSEDIEVTALFSLAGEEIQGEYSLDQGESWFLYTGSLSISRNCTLLFRAGAGDGYVYKEYTIGNIDKAAPVISDITTVLSPGKSSVTVSVLFSDDHVLKSAQYKIGTEGVWQNYTGEFKVRENTNVFFRATDMAGNTSESSIEIDQISSSGLTENDIDGNGIADILMVQRKSAGKLDLACGTWLLTEEGVPHWGNLSSVNAFKRILGTGRSLPFKESADVYVLDTGKNTVGFWRTDSAGKVEEWQTIETFNSRTSVAGLGDFNGDGITDLLLQNTNGAVGCGFVLEGECVWNYFQSLGKEWRLSAVGDFNGDSVADVVMSHAAGFAGCWLTQENGSVEWSSLDTLSNGFSIVGAGDFNGDGTDDILLRSGDYFGSWEVRDGSAVSWIGLGTGKGTVEQIADFTGDGIDDIRLRTAGGDLGILAVMGEDNVKWHYFGSVGNEWNTSFAALQ